MTRELHSRPEERWRVGRSWRVRHTDPRACKKQSLEAVGEVQECSSPMLRLPPLQLKRQVDSSELAVGTLSSACLALST
jgi:hypothetical protein